MTESLEAVRSDPRGAPAGAATIGCGRCRNQFLPWELRVFGDKSICPQCYEATLELARGAIRLMPAGEARRSCANCRALRQPHLGSAWCGAVELGDERARICANFVDVRLEETRAALPNGRTAVFELWGSLSEALRTTLGAANYQNWFGAVEPMRLDGDELVLAVPDEYVRDWLEQRLHTVVRSALSLIGQPDVRVTYVVEHMEAPPVEIQRKAEAKAAFNTHYTFAEFIVGSGNRLAHASALACVDKPGRAYNPLVLWGGVGVGKTHLLQAIGQEVIERGGGEVLYATSETFTNELISAIRNGSTREFRDRFRSVDYLLLDDIQFIAGKEATQEEFFHTFNALHGAGKQIVVTSDRPPGDLRTLEDRLRSRFAWGLSADIQPPDLETRMAILRSKAALHHRRLPETVLNALAGRVRGNVRELEGALNRVVAYAELRGTEPDMDVVRAVLGDPEAADHRCTPADVLQAVSTYYRVRASDLAGPQRERGITQARHMAMYLLREEAKLSLIDVGSHLGGRNHSTVIHGCDKIAVEVKRKGRVRGDVQAIKQLIYGVM